MSQEVLIKDLVNDIGAGRVEVGRLENRLYGMRRDNEDDFFKMTTMAVSEGYKLVSKSDDVDVISRTIESMNKVVSSVLTEDDFKMSDPEGLSSKSTRLIVGLILIKTQEEANIKYRELLSEDRYCELSIKNVEEISFVYKEMIYHYKEWLKYNIYASDEIISWGNTLTDLGLIEIDDKLILESIYSNEIGKNQLFYLTEDESKRYSVVKQIEKRVPNYKNIEIQNYLYK